MGRKRKQIAEFVARELGRRAVVYLRVSTEMQAMFGGGIEAQRDACAFYVQNRQYETVYTAIDEAESGSLEERPELLKAIELCMTGQVDVFVCYAVDRQAREVEIFQNVRKKFLQAGIRFETVRENMDFADPRNLLMGDIWAAFAAQDKRNTVERLYRGRRVRSKHDGRGSGPVPYGYRRLFVETDARGKAVWQIAVNEEEAKTIRLIFRLRRQGWTYRQVASE